MGGRQTRNGVAYDPAALDRVEQRFWHDIWASMPAEEAAEHGLQLRRFGAIQAHLVTDLGTARFLNLILGAGEEGATIHDLAAATEWALRAGVTPFVPVTPGLPGTGAAEEWLREHGFQPGYGWMKFVRDPHPPRFEAPEVEVVEVRDPEQEPFGMIAAVGFKMPSWGAGFFAHLPGREGWLCYVARVDGEAQACAAMLIDGGVAEFGIAATLEGARGRGCQQALLHRRIVDAAEAGCETLFVETGERVPDRPSISYRNILRAGFEEAYPRPNWELAAPSLASD